MEDNYFHGREITTAYADGWEHIADELKLLDLRIHIQAHKNRVKYSSGPAVFKETILTDEEICRLIDEHTTIANEDNPDPFNDSDLASLSQSLKDFENNIDKRLELTEQKKCNLPFPLLSKIFHLTPFEEQCLIICLSLELDKKYEKLYAYLHDDIHIKSPTVGLVLDLLCHHDGQKLKARSFFHKDSPLLKHSLLQMTDDSFVPLISKGLKLDDRIANFLLGLDEIDGRLSSFVRKGSNAKVFPPESINSPLHDRIEKFIRTSLSRTDLPVGGLVLYLRGPFGSGQESLTEGICRTLKIELLWIDLDRMQEAEMPFEMLAQLLGREAALSSAALALKGFDSLTVTDGKAAGRLRSVIDMIENYSWLTFIFGEEEWRPERVLRNESFFTLEFAVPDERERKTTWQRLLQQEALGELNAGYLASQFRFTPDQIEDAMLEARNRALWRSPDVPALTMDDLFAACRNQSSNILGRLAGKIEIHCGWADLVLPADQMSKLKEISVQARYRDIVYGEWGFGRKLSGGKGLNALFSGPPGTGKTLAAEVVAGEMNLDMYKIDLSLVVSKYIGETEKNLGKIFEAARMSNAILFFDEADALFGKRSEVKDAHDRYANIEIGYLLQKLEEYEGIVILATNLGKNIDPAFQRRMHFLVEFPFPDEELRESIWMSVFPSQAPVDERIDFASLAGKFRLAGGNIRNVALFAAFRAAEQGKSIEMYEIMEGIRREYQKMGGNPPRDFLLSEQAEAIQ